MHRDLRQSTDRRAGFSLPELMVAILLLVVGVLGIASVMVAVNVRQVRSTTLTEMTMLAESKFEELRAYSLLKSADTSQVTLGGSLTSYITDHADHVTSPVGRPYTRRWVVEAGPGDTRKVTLRVEADQETRAMAPAADFQTLMLVVK